MYVCMYVCNVSRGCIMLFVVTSLCSDVARGGQGSRGPQNSKHQMCSFKLKMHQNRFLPGLHPGPSWGSLQRSPDP